MSTVRSSLSQLWRLIERRERSELLVLVALTVAGAFAEMVTIGMVVPFLALLAATGESRRVKWLEPIFNSVGAKTAAQELVVATVFLCLAALASAVFRIVLTRKTRNFASNFGHRLSVELQRRMLLQPYAWHIQQHSSGQLAAIEKSEQVAEGVMLPAVQGAASFVLGLFVLTALLSIAPLPTLVAVVVLAAIYFALAALARSRVKLYSRNLDEAYARRLRVVQEGLGGIREAILDCTQPRIAEEFRAADGKLARARANIGFMAAIPRFAIEAFAMMTIAAIALLLSRRDGGLVAALPILGALALGGQRLLP